MDECVWRCGAFRFEWALHRGKVGILTVSGPGLPLPDHMLSSLGKARSMTTSIADVLGRGQVPREGMFRALAKARGGLRVAVRARLAKARQIKNAPGLHLDPQKHRWVREATAMQVAPPRSPAPDPRWIPEGVRRTDPRWIEDLEAAAWYHGSPAEPSRLTPAKAPSQLKAAWVTADPHYADSYGPASEYKISIRGEVLDLSEIPEARGAVQWPVATVARWAEILGCEIIDQDVADEECRLWDLTDGRDVDFTGAIDLSPLQKIGAILTIEASAMALGIINGGARRT
jgi:hypothetical protein